MLTTEFRLTVYVGDRVLAEAAPAERHQHLARRLPPADVVPGTR